MKKNNLKLKATETVIVNGMVITSNSPFNNPEISFDKEGETSRLSGEMSVGYCVGLECFIARRFRVEVFVFPEDKPIH